MKKLLMSLKCKKLNRMNQDKFYTVGRIAKVEKLYFGYKLYTIESMYGNDIYKMVTADVLSYGINVIGLIENNIIYCIINK